MVNRITAPFLRVHEEGGLGDALQMIVAENCTAQQCAEPRVEVPKHGSLVAVKSVGSGTPRKRHQPIVAWGVRPLSPALTEPIERMSEIFKDSLTSWPPPSAESIACKAALHEEAVQSLITAARNREWKIAAMIGQTERNFGKEEGLREGRCLEQVLKETQMKNLSIELEGKAKDVKLLWKEKYDAVKKDLFAVQQQKAVMERQLCAQNAELQSLREINGLNNKDAPAAEADVVNAFDELLNEGSLDWDKLLEGLLS